MFKFVSLQSLSGTTLSIISYIDLEIMNFFVTMQKSRVYFISFERTVFANKYSRKFIELIFKFIIYLEIY